MPYAPFHLYGIILIVIPLISQSALYLLVIKHLSQGGTGRRTTKKVIPVVMIIVNIPIILLRVAPEMFYAGFARHFIMIPFYAYQTMSVAILLTVLIWFLVIRFPASLVRKIRTSAPLKTNPVPESAGRREFMKKAAIGLGAYTFAGSMYSIYNRDDFQVKKVTLHLRKLPEVLSGLRIVMISDIHSGLYMTADDMSRYKEELDKLNADLIFMPGDFVTSKTREILPLVKSFSGVKSRFGTYACLGNHDFFADPNAIAEKLRENGVNVLRNETTEVEINGAKLVLSGVDDGAHANFPKVAFEANSLDAPRILLCHQPYYFEKAVAGGFDAMLSGHTHGGQIVLLDFLGIKLTPAALVSPFVSGKYFRGTSVMYVTRGIGTVGIPVRVNCPPEVTMLTLAKSTSNKST